jgi:hypothetical protein
MSPARGIDDLYHGEPRFGVQILDPPEALELGLYVRVGDALVIGIDHGDQARIRGALDIVLAAKGVKTRAGPADLTGHQRQ